MSYFKLPVEWYHDKLHFLQPVSKTGMEGSKVDPVHYHTLIDTGFVAETKMFGSGLTKSSKQKGCESLSDQFLWILICSSLKFIFSSSSLP